MLTASQQKYLSTIPEGKVADIQPWNPRTKVIAEELIGRIHSLIPDIPILFMGSAALELPGMNDLDILVLSPASKFEACLPKLKRLFGEPRITKTVEMTWSAWEFQNNGFAVEIHLTDPETPSTKEQIQLFELLKNDPNLLEEYRQLKKSCNGLPFREYQRRKYEFYNRILGL